MAGSRKRQKQKKRSCALCKCYKMGRGNRWTAKEAARLVRWERQRREWKGRRVMDWKDDW